MAEQYGTEDKSSSKSRDEKILEQAMKHWKACEDAQDQRELRREDLKFYLGDSDNQWQWDAAMLSARKGPGRPPRPCLTINRAPQHVRQITNEQRQNSPAIRIRPVDDVGDKEVAEIYQGWIRHVEQRSGAQDAYDTACDFQVITGAGYFRIVTEYISDNSFELEARIDPVYNPFSVHLDPTDKTKDGSGAMYGFVIDDGMSKDEFKRLYPGKEPMSWDDDSGWNTEDTVRIAEYFCIKFEDDTLLLLDNGQTVLESELSGLEVVPVKTRKIQKRRCMWYKLTSFAVLSEQEFPSQWIPIIKVVGDDIEVDGERVIKGAIRNAKDPLRLNNYWVSSEAEAIALQIKAPYVGYEGQFEGHEDQWAMANLDTLPYLQVRAVPDPSSGQALPLPQRQQPPMMPTAFTAGKLAAIEDIKAVFGQYNASLGQTSNETSGKAIMARQREGDTGSYHYLKNLAMSVRHGGRILVDMLPRMKTKAGLLRLIGEDGAESEAKVDPSINRPMVEVRSQEGKLLKIFNLDIGTYDVAVTTGPSFTTKRAEMSEFMTALAQADPTLMQKAGDLIVRAQDVAGADQIADRLKKFLPPGVAEQEDDDQDPKAQLAQAQQAIQAMEQGLQNADAMTQQMQQEMQKLQAENAQLKVKNDTGAIQLKAELESMAQEQVNASETMKMEEQLARKSIELEVAKLKSAQMQLDIEKERAMREIEDALARAGNGGEEGEEGEEGVINGAKEDNGALIAAKETLDGLAQAQEAMMMAITAIHESMAAPVKKVSKFIIGPDGLPVGMETTEAPPDTSNMTKQ
jgi:hypothetical protein